MVWVCRLEPLVARRPRGGAGGAGLARGPGAGAVVRQWRRCMVGLLARSGARMGERLGAGVTIHGCVRGSKGEGAILALVGDVCNYARE